MRAIILALLSVFATTAVADETRILVVGTPVRLSGVLVCTTLELAAGLYETHRAYGYRAAHVYIKQNLPDGARPAKPHCTGARGEEYAVTEIAQLKGVLDFPDGNQYTEVARIERTADKEIFWAFFGNTRILMPDDIEPDPDQRDA